MNLRSILPASRLPFATRSWDADSFTTMRREMERLFDDLSGGQELPASRATNIVAPKVDVVETTKGLEISAELPGVDQKDIDLDLADGILTLKAERRAEREERDEKKHYHIVERCYGTLLRRFALPFDADAEKVEAQFDKGILHVFVPRLQTTEREKTKIAIKAKQNS